MRRVVAAATCRTCPTRIRRKLVKHRELFFRLIRSRWIQPKHGKHAAGFSFLGTVGVVPTQITGGARAAVVHLLNAERAALLMETMPEELTLIVPV